MFLCLSHTTRSCTYADAASFSPPAPWLWCEYSFQLEGSYARARLGSWRRWGWEGMKQLPALWLWCNNCPAETCACSTAASLSPPNSLVVGSCARARQLEAASTLLQLLLDSTLTQPSPSATPYQLEAVPVLQPWGTWGWRQREERSFQLPGMGVGMGTGKDLWLCRPDLMAPWAGCGFWARCCQPLVTRARG